MSPILYPDHGTFIPHPMKGSETIISNKIKHFNIIKNNLHDFKYESNTPLKELEKYNNPNSLNKCVVKYNYQVSPEVDHLDYIRIIVLVILQKEYKTNTFKITWNKNS